MYFNEHQTRLWINMINLIEDFYKGKIQYFDMVYKLEGALDAGEFKDEFIIKQWYDFWEPLEIVAATTGNKTSLEDINKYLSKIESFLINILASSATSPSE